MNRTPTRLTISNTSLTRSSIAICSMAILFLVGCVASTSVPSSNTLIDYKRSGGIAGRTQHLQIMLDGTAHLKRNEQKIEFNVTPQEVETLKTLLQEADFQNLNASYKPSGKSADLFEYTLSYAGKRVTMMDTAMPESIYPLLEQLDQFVVDQFTAEQ